MTIMESGFFRKDEYFSEIEIANSLLFVILIQYVLGLIIPVKEIVNFNDICTANLH